LPANVCPTPNARKLTGGVSRPVQRMVGRTKVSCSRIWLWLHCAAVLYSTTDLPVGDGSAPESSSLPLATKARTGLHGNFCALGRSADRAVWPQRSGGQAASSGTGSGSENHRSELRSNSRALPLKPRTRAACSTTAPPRCHHGRSSVLVRAEGPKRLQTNSVNREHLALRLGEFLSHLLGCCPGRFPSLLENMRRHRLPQRAPSQSARH
jgi:hypothetical protein